MLRILATGVIVLGLMTACGGGGGGGGGAAVGSIQVLNNAGLDYADVEVWQGATKITEIGGGLAQGATFTFSNLPVGIYDIEAIPPGIIVAIRFYNGIVVLDGQTTNFTMTP